MTHIKRQKRILRHNRVRAKVQGTADRPRASVFRSLQHTYVQFINDEDGVTLLALDDRVLAHKDAKTKSDRARALGKKAGEELTKKGINTVVFDRGGFTYHGRVRAVAEGLREAGVEV